MRMVLEHMPRKPKIGYTPAPGLITFFSRTCTCRRNPNPQQRPTMPPDLTLLDHRSYAEVVRVGMEGNGMFGHGNGHVTGSAGFRGQALGQAYARQGYQQPYQWYGPAGFQGNRCGGRNYDQRSRGFRGNFRQAEFWPSHGDQCLPNAMSRDMEVTLHRQGTVHGNVMQHNQSAEVHGQRSSQGAQDWANTGVGSSSGDGGNVKEDLSSIPAGMISLFQ
jgi:hypothetical protein